MPEGIGAGGGGADELSCGLFPQPAKNVSNTTAVDMPAVRLFNTSVPMYQTHDMAAA